MADKYEYHVQREVFKWALLNQTIYPELALMHSSQNGLKSDGYQVNKAKLAGLKPGIPDIFLPVARGGYYGLFIELKKTNGILRKEQQTWLVNLRKQGYSCVVFYNHMDAMTFIEDYLNNKIIK